MTPEEKSNRRKSTLSDQVAKNLETVLNKNGYNFQYSVYRHAENLSKQNKGHWYLEGTEIPVAFGNDITHVDFVLFKHPYDSSWNKRVFLVAECKRVDPARGFWCFTKNPYTWRNSERIENTVQFDSIRRFSDIPQYNATSSILRTERDILDLGLEIKTGAKGDSTGGEKNASINSTISQVLRGTSGYINYLSKEGAATSHLELDKDNVFVPAIFTTAKIFVSEVDLASANLQTGHLPSDSVTVEEKDWIWFNHNRSEHLSHSVKFNAKATNNYDLYFREFTRSVAIVGPNGLDSFFEYNFYGLLD